MGNVRVDIFRGRTWWQRVLRRRADYIGSARLIDLNHRQARLEAGPLAPGTEVVLIVRDHSQPDPIKARGRALPGSKLTIGWEDLSFETLGRLKAAAFPMTSVAA